MGSGRFELEYFEDPVSVPFGEELDRILRYETSILRNEANKSFVMNNNSRTLFSQRRAPRHGQPNEQQHADEDETRVQRPLRPRLGPAADQVCIL